MHCEGCRRAYNAQAHEACPWCAARLPTPYAAPCVLELVPLAMPAATWPDATTLASPTATEPAQAAPTAAAPSLALLAGPRKGPKRRPSLRALVANGADAAAFAFTLGLARVEQLFAKGP